MLLQSATNILIVLQMPPPSLIPTIEYGDNAKNAIDHLAQLLQYAVLPTKPQAHKLSPSLPYTLLRSNAPRPVPRVQPGAPPRVQRRDSLIWPPIAATAAHVSNNPSLITFAFPDPLKDRQKVLSVTLAHDFFATLVANHIYNEKTGKKKLLIVSLPVQI